MPARSFLALLITCVTVMVVMTGGTFAATPDTVTSMPDLSLGGTAGVASDTSGNLYIADTANNQIVMVTPSGAITRFGSVTPGFVPFTDTTVLGDAAVQFNAPVGIAADSSGNVYIADTGNHRIHLIVADTATKRISATSRIVTVAGNGIEGFSGDGATATGASLNSPSGVAVDASGNIYIADNGNYRIRKELAVKVVTVKATGITTYTPGVISTIAGDGTPTKLTVYGIALSPLPAGDLYIADAGNNRILKMTGAKGTPFVFAGNGTAGFSGDGGLASLAQLNQPSGVITNGEYLYITDTMNGCVRRVSHTTNVISTRLGMADKFAAIIAPEGFTNPVSVAVDGAGTLYVEDTGNKVIQQVSASVSAITTATPPGGSYPAAQNVVLTTRKAATIYYTTDGSPPTVKSQPYTVPIVISATTTLRFTSIDFAGNQEVINSATFTIDTKAPETSITVNATPAVDGVYYSALATLAVSLKSNELNTSIFYTTNGSVPTTASTKYSAPFSIPVSTAMTTPIIQFFGVDAAGLKSDPVSQKFSVIALATTASPTGGGYSTVKNVTLTSNNPSTTIYFTLDGTDPSTGSTVYAGPVEIAASSTLKYRAIDGNSNLEQTRIQIYTIDTSVPVVSASPIAGSFSMPQTVTLTSNEPNATIYYTTTGIAPTTSSSKYSKPLAISKTTTLMYFAVDAAGNKSAVGTQTYTIDSVAPVTKASVLSGTYSSIQSVTLTSDDAKATIYFTIDGSTPTVASTKYTGPLLISSTTTLQYFAKDVLGNVESVKIQEYIVNTLTSTASPKGGLFTTPQTVVLTTNNTGATIYYTVDGTTPSKDSKVSKSTQKYSKPLLIQDYKTTLKFFSVDAQGVSENVNTEIYTVDSAPPTTTATCGATANRIELTTTDSADLLPEIMYSVSNSVLHTGTAFDYYSAPITFTNNTIVKFFAVDAAGNSETMKTISCSTVVAPLDVKPALYLETLADGSTTSNSSLSVGGHVAPSVTLTINGTDITPTTDGSFLHTIKLAANVNTITTVATKGDQSTTSTRIVNYEIPGPHAEDPLIAIGTSNGVIGNSARVPIILTSGYQAATVSIDLDTTRFSGVLANPTVEIAQSAATQGKFVRIGEPSAGVFKIVITDINPPSDGVAKLTPLRDGVIAYLTFSIVSSNSTHEPLTVIGYSATDPAAKAMTVKAVTQGAVHIVSKPGNAWNTDANTEVAVTLKDVQDALYMLLDPVTYPVSGSADLDADGRVQIHELQQVIKSLIGL